MNNKFLSGVTLAIGAALALSASTTAMAGGTPSSPSVWASGCTMYNATHGLIFGQDWEVTQADSGNVTVKCKAYGLANSTGKPVKFQDFACQTPYGMTYRSWEVIDTLGNATMTCQIKKPQ